MPGVIENGSYGMDVIRAVIGHRIVRDALEALQALEVDVRHQRNQDIPLHPIQMPVQLRDGSLNVTHTGDRVRRILRERRHLDLERSNLRGGVPGPLSQARHLCADIDEEAGQAIDQAIDRASQMADITIDLDGPFRQMPDPLLDTGQLVDHPRFEWQVERPQHPLDHRANGQHPRRRWSRLRPRLHRVRRPLRGFRATLAHRLLQCRREGNPVEWVLQLFQQRSRQREVFIRKVAR
ncbi:hypothetical protein D3C87_1176980 [compost metagenome]